MIKKILTNEIRTILGRNPTDEEVRIFVSEINEYLLEQERAGKLDRVDMASIGLKLYEIRDNMFTQCEECGEWYLIGSDEMNSDGYYCRRCKPEYDPDMMIGGHDYY